MKIILLALLLCLSCTHAPIDDTPSWSSNGRYGLEMAVDCNSVNHSIGLIGCAFNGPIEGTLTIPNIIDGHLMFQSPECDDFTVRTKENTDVKIPLTRLHSTDTGKPCSYAISQSFDKIGNIVFDSVITGRFFVSSLPNSKYYSHLKFKIKGQTFNGVGWHQNKRFEMPPSMTVIPSGQNGIFRMMCGDEEIKVVKYTTSPFTISFSEPIKTCDYAMVATNADHPDIEFAVFVNSEPMDITLDVSTPQIKTKWGKIYFEFKEGNSEDRPVVFAVKVNDKLCLKTNKCGVKNKSNLYTVKAYTMNGRVFYGVYNSNTNEWGD